MEYKRCTKCHKEQDIEQFGCTKRNSDGSVRYRSSWCRDCRIAYSRAKSLNPKKIPFVGENCKECLECRNIKNLCEFSPSKRGRLNRSAYCKPCQSKRVVSSQSWHEKNRARTQKWRDENRLEYRAKHRIHQFNRRSIIKATEDGTVTSEFIKSVYSSEICHWCQKETALNQRTLEHLIELSQGGSHTRNNITMACRSCNSARKNKHVKN